MNQIAKRTFPPAHGWSVRALMLMVVAAMSAATIGLAMWALAPIGSPTVASAHGGNSKDYRSIVTGISPVDLPISAEVKGGDDRLRIENQGDQPLYIYGYQVDPKTSSPYVDTNYYLRIEPGGVFINTHSSAFILNQNRVVSGSDGLTAVGPATWKQVQREVPSWTFHDHRIHWMGSRPPASIDAHSAKAQKVFNWTVPVKYGDTKGSIKGRLTYIGGQTAADTWMTTSAYLAGGLVVLLAVILIAGRRYRRRRAAA